MATVLCPTRGGPASYPNQDRAIAIAKERNAGLVFLYVASVQFLNLAASPVLVDMEAEMEAMGEFLLTMAQERAEKAGIQVKTEVRRGTFRHVVKEVIDEHQITTLVLGSAAGLTGVTTPSYLEDLTQWILKETGVEIFVVREGEIIEHHTSSQPNPS
jgi:nucleotide-binding universal stress UspA family protein